MKRKVDLLRIRLWPRFAATVARCVLCTAVVSLVGAACGMVLLDPSRSMVLVACTFFFLMTVTFSPAARSVCVWRELRYHEKWCEEARRRSPAELEDSEHWETFDRFWKQYENG
jgi:hypothetical protein